MIRTEYVILDPDRMHKRHTDSPHVAQAYSRLGFRVTASTWRPDS